MDKRNMIALAAVLFGIIGLAISGDAYNKIQSKKEVFSCKLQQNQLV
jgi:hypothetical protein